MPDPCDHPTYAAYAAAVRVVFHTNFVSESEEDDAVAAMQAAGKAWKEATL